MNTFKAPAASESAELNSDVWIFAASESSQNNES